MTVGEKLDEVMAWKGINQKSLSELTGISRSMISEYVRDATDPPLSALQKMASALSISAWTLLNGEGLPVTAMDMTRDEYAVLLEYRQISKKSQALIKTVLHSVKDLEHREGNQ